ncbi:ankyrin repeat domain-containing protein 34B [Gasterosteus aculeatus]
MADPLSDSSPLISAAASCKLRLVRLLVEGGAQVNGCNPRGETPLLAACKAMRGEPAGREAVKLLTYLLLNKADPNARDRAGRTALMYACVQRTGAQVASCLIAAGADPGMEDYSGASALVYAINAQHRPTLKVLVDACRARGRDIIIIATEIGGNGGPVTRHYLNVPPCPDNSPASCMSPSDVVLTTGSPNSPEGESVFNFRAAGQRGSSSSSSSSLPPARHRVLSEPWLAVHNLACLNRTYEEGMRERRLQEEADREDPRRERRGDEEPRCPRSGVQRRPKRLEGETEDACREDFLPRLSQSVLSPAEGRSPQGGQSRPDPQRSFAPGGSTLLHHSQLRRNTLPSVTALHLPPLADHPHLRVPTRVSTSESRRMVFLPQPPGSSPPSSSSRGSARPAVLPRLSLTSSAGSDRSKRALRRHSVQLEQMGVGEIL